LPLYTCSKDNPPFERMGFLLVKYVDVLTAYVHK